MLYVMWIKIIIKIVSNHNKKHGYKPFDIWHLHLYNLEKDPMIQQLSRKMW
jgi:hypothetical protein